jgi:opacity protein-like surface antigen
MKRMLVGMALFVLLAAPASAQTEDRGFVRALVGATVGAGPGAVVGGTVGFKASEKLQVLGEFGRMTNIMPSSVIDEIEVAAASAAQSLGGKHSSDATARATYGLVGARYNLGVVSGALTFIEIGAGAANVKSKVTALIRGSETLQGDISNLVSTSFTRSTPATKGAFMIGGGIVLGVTQRTAVEVGARYIRVATSDPGINASKIYGAYRLGF